jgi:hypothetical protein
MQNFAPSGATAEQAGQRRSSAEPQFMQNLALAGFSAPQLEQAVTGQL